MAAAAAAAAVCFCASYWRAQQKPEQVVLTPFALYRNEHTRQMRRGHCGNLCVQSRSRDPVRPYANAKMAHTPEIDRSFFKTHVHTRARSTGRRQMVEVAHGCVRFGCVCVIHLPHFACSNVINYLSNINIEKYPSYVRSRFFSLGKYNNTHSCFSRQTER